MKSEFLPDAEDEFREATRYYETQKHLELVLLSSRKCEGQSGGLSRTRMQP